MRLTRVAALLTKTAVALRDVAAVTEAVKTRRIQPVLHRIRNHFIYEEVGKKIYQPKDAETRRPHRRPQNWRRN